MKIITRGLLLGVFALAVVACQQEPVEPTTPSDMFSDESKPLGDAGIDPYRPAGPKPLIEIPAGPKPETNRPQSK